MNDISNIFSTSSLSISSEKDGANMTKEELIAEIMPKLQDILKERFPGNAQRQKIKVFKDRLNFAAPCCGDSAKDNSKKRGNIILEGPHQFKYKCHNCGTCMSMYNFFKRYGQKLSLDTIDFLISHKSDYKFISNLDSSINMLYDSDKINSYAIDREYFKSKCNLEECDLQNYGHLYLVQRNQFDFKKFLYHPKHNLLFVLNLTNENKILGVQIRQLNKTFVGGKYKTYKLSKIYDSILKENVEVPDEIDSLSMIFNILLVNYDVPITVVEGPLDSFLIKNCIATCGASNHTGFNFEYKFLYDDDLTGRKHAIEKLSEGYEVFMWDKLKQDLTLPTRKKWDINDLVNYCNNNHIKMPRLDKYYSNDNLDLLDI